MGSFDAAQSDLIRQAHLRSNGFTIQWQGSSASTLVLIADLNPAKTWRYRLNGGDTRTLTVNKSGVATIDVTGSRSHTIVVS